MVIRIHTYSHFPSPRSASLNPRFLSSSSPPPTSSPFLLFPSVCGFRSVLRRSRELFFSGLHSSFSFDLSRCFFHFPLVSRHYFSLHQPASFIIALHSPLPPPPHHRPPRAIQRSKQSKRPSVYASLAFILSVAGSTLVVAGRSFARPLQPDPARRNRAPLTSASLSSVALAPPSLHAHRQA